MPFQRPAASQFKNFSINTPTVTVTFPRVPLRYFAILCEFLDSIHVRSEDVLRVAGLDRHMLGQSSQTITIPQMELLLCEADKASGHRQLAFELGSRIKSNSHDILSLALISSVSLDQMLSLYARYYRLITPLFGMSYRRLGDNAELIFKPAVKMPQRILLFCLETIAVSAYNQIKSSLQTRPSNFNIHVSMNPPQHLERYKSLGLARFRFSSSQQAEVRISINDAHLDCTLPMANAQAVKLAEERCQTMLRKEHEKGNWSDWLSMMLQQHEDDCQPTLTDMAKILNISPRTLDRYLRKENTTYRDLSTRIRNQRACQLLDEGCLSISQIAYTLGYTDISNFSRSFKKASGVCPTDYRNDVRNAAVDASIGVTTLP